MVGEDYCFWYYFLGMKKEGKFFVFLFAISAIFFGQNFINNHIAFASVPQVTDCKFDNTSQNTTFNPNNSTLSIDISSDQAVKFNTISMCHSDDSVCSRTTAVKYFTNTSSYLQTINKIWDGKTGGSSPTLVSAGTYRVRATVANQAAESNSPGDFCSASIIVDFSYGGANDPGGNNGAENTGTTTATTTPPVNSSSVSNSTAGYSSNSGILSVHYYQEGLSDYDEVANVFEVSAGRDRLSYVGSPVSFEAKSKISAGQKGAVPNFKWSFGDGASENNGKVAHTYKYPGEYNVVLNANLSGVNSISRAKVKVLIPELNISEKPDGSVEISNKGANEINLYGWKILAAGRAYSFPLDTIISAGKSVIFPAEYLKIPLVGNVVTLMDASAKEIVSASGNLPLLKPEKTISVSDVDKFALEYKRLLQLARPAPVATVSTSSKISTVSNTPQVKVPLTASVISAVIDSATSTVNYQNSEIGNNVSNQASAGGGFWSKLLHPINTIKDAFYR